MSTITTFSYKILCVYKIKNQFEANLVMTRRSEKRPLFCANFLSTQFLAHEICHRCNFHYLWSPDKFVATSGNVSLDSHLQMLKDHKIWCVEVVKQKFILSRVTHQRPITFTQQQTMDTKSSASVCSPSVLHAKAQNKQEDGVDIAQKLNNVWQR